jgi:hypothetical protein
MHQIKTSKKGAELFFYLKNDKRVEPFQLMEYPHLDAWNAALNCLIKIGFRVTVDPRIHKDYSILSQYHKYGNWKGLEVKSEIYPTGFKFEFYQNFNTGDRAPGNGEHALKRFDLMPYLIKKRYLYTVQKLSQTIASLLPCVVSWEEHHREVEKVLIGHKQASWHNKTPVNSLEDFQAQMSAYDLSSNNSKDRDKKTIVCGEIKYYRDRKSGRLMRGRVYHSLNDSWWVILNRYECTAVSSADLFDPGEEDMKARRLKKGRVPEGRQKELDLLFSLTPAKLKHLLRRKQKQTA